MEKNSVSREEVAERLRRHGINLTFQRLEIAYVLFSRMEHFSADQILSVVNKSHAATSKATVYNTLKLLLENKLIREVIVDPNKVFYDPNIAPHHHFYDTVTGQLTDIAEGTIGISAMPPLPPGVVADGVDIIVRTRPAAGR